MTVLDDVVTDAELAQRLGCPISDIKRAWRQGRLKGVRLSTRLRLRFSAVEEWMKQCYSLPQPTDKKPAPVSIEHAGAKPTIKPE